MSQIPNATASGVQATSYSAIASKNPQTALALLMMDMAELNKTNAQAKISDIEGQQKLKRECSEALNAARNLKDSGVHGTVTQEDAQHMINVGRDWQQRGWAAVEGLDKYYKDRGMTPGQYGDVPTAKRQWEDAITKLENLKKVNAFVDKDSSLKMPSTGSKQEWETLIANLQTSMDSIGGNTQTQMVQLQDIMGQYNSQIQGANAAIAQANQINTTLAKGG